MNSSEDILGCVNKTYFKATNAERYYFYACYAVFTVATLFGNCLVWRAFMITQKLRTPANYFLLSLSAADFLLVSVVIGLLSINELEDFRMTLAGRNPCLIIVFTNITVIIGSILSVLGIAAERYLSVVQPLRHMALVTSRRSAICVVAIWVIAVILAIPIFVKNAFVIGKPCDIRVVNHLHLGRVIGPIIVFGIVMSSVLYVRIFSIAIQQSRKMVTLIKSVSSSHLRGLQSTAEDKIEEEMRCNENKVTKMAAMVLGLLFVTWLPILFSSLVKQCHETKLYHITNRILELLNYSNSFMNPIIYQCRSEPFRLAFKKILSIR